MNRRTHLALTALAFASTLLGCSTIDKAQAPQLERNASWTVLPFENHTETPMAGNRAEAIASAVLHAQGIGQVHHYTGASAANHSAFVAPSSTSMDADLTWAKDKGIVYALTGAVDEWRYKVGVDGEPAVGITMRIIDVNTGATVWSGAGGKSGWSREALSSVAQKLIRDLLAAGVSNIR